MRRRARIKHRAAETAQAAQLAEHRAAQQRLLDLARGNAGPDWDGPTTPLPNVTERPLMTPAQRFRGNGGRP
ncbi:MAG TPA: hypothetical protein VF755_19750 [Catenuloplanes sp.]|jgi:hypothetical protein